MKDLSKDQTPLKPHNISGFRLLSLVPALLRNPLPTLVKLNRKHGHLLTFDAGKYQKIHVISDPNLVKHLLKTNAKNYQRSPVIKALKPLLGNGIFISDGDDWTQQHKMLKPAFHDQYMQLYLTEVDRSISELSGEWDKVDEAFNIEPSVEKMMLSILLKTVFGFRQALDLDKIISCHKAILTEVGIEKQKLDFFKQKIFGIKSTSGQKRMLQNVDYLKSVAEQILDGMDKKHNPLHEQMQNANAQRPEQIDMILNLLFAGYDTTASALSWTLYCISRNPEWQQKIVDEALSNQSTSVKMVVQESLRLFPPVWSILRVSEKDDVIESWEIPKNSFLMINVYGLHRNTRVWTKPDEFYPEHFSTENLKGKTYAYIPFGQGQRMCIGKPLAMQELEMMVVKLCRIHEFQNTVGTKRDPIIRPDIIVKSRNGLSLKVTKRVP